MKTELVNIATGLRLDLADEPNQIKGGWFAATLVGDEACRGSVRVTVRAWRVEKTADSANEVIQDLPIGTVFDLPVNATPQFIIKTSEDELTILRGEGAHPYTWPISGFATACKPENVKIIYRPGGNS